MLASSVSHHTHLSCDPLLQAFFANPQLPGADVHDTVHLQDLPPQAQRAVNAYMDDPGDADEAPEWTEEDVVHLHWRLLLELRRLPDPETPLEAKLDTLAGHAAMATSAGGVPAVASAQDPAAASAAPSDLANGLS